jgi:head-tail adaptor
MDSGLLKHKITLQKPTITSNDFGTVQDIAYTDYKTVSARMIDIGGNKTIQNFELFASKLLQFEIRYRTDFDETYRIKHSGRYYSILNIKEAEYKKTLTITAELQQ